MISNKQHITAFCYNIKDEKLTKRNRNVLASAIFNLFTNACLRASQFQYTTPGQTPEHLTFKKN